MIRLATGLALCVGVLLLSACAGGPPIDVEERPPVAAAPKPKPSPAPSTAPAPTTHTPPAAAQSQPYVLKRGGAFYKDDGPGDNPPPDMASIPDAEPQAEALHPFANRPYSALGQDYVPMQQVQPYSKRGIASWYGRRFNGKPTSSGEPYDMYAMTGAHPTLPIPSYARVTNLTNNQSVIVRINDRGPFHSSRVIDLSYTAAWKLGYADRGSAEVLVESIVPDEMDMVVAQIDRKPVKAKKTAEVPPPLAASTPPKPEPVVVAEAPAAAQPSPASVPPAGAAAAQGVYLQLGAFASLANANHFRDYVLGELKWLTHNLSSQFAGDKYRLHLGPFQSLEEARQVAERIAQVIKLKPFLVTK